MPGLVLIKSLAADHGGIVLLMELAPWGPLPFKMLGRNESAISALRAALRAVALRNAAAAAVRQGFAKGKTLVRRKSRPTLRRGPGDNTAYPRLISRVA